MSSHGGIICSGIVHFNIQTRISEAFLPYIRMCKIHSDSENIDDRANKIVLGQFVK